MILLIGLGNPLREDDGLGPRVVEAVIAGGLPDDVRALVCHQLMPELAETMALATRVVLVDAAVDREPGHVSVERVEAALAAGPTTHHLTPAAIVALSAALYDGKAETWLVRVGGAAFETGQALSPMVEDALPEAARLVRSLIGCETSVPLANSSAGPR